MTRTSKPENYLKIRRIADNNIGEPVLGMTIPKWMQEQLKNRHIRFKQKLFNGSKYILLEVKNGGFTWPPKV